MSRLGGIVVPGLPHPTQMRCQAGIDTFIGEPAHDEP
jgi:hypothetical protein